MEFNVLRIMYQRSVKKMVFFLHQGFNYSKPNQIGKGHLVTCFGLDWLKQLLTQRYEIGHVDIVI